MPDHVNPKGNEPLKQGKATYFEGGTRLPFLFKHPGHIKPGTLYKNPVISLDIFPTLMAACGAIEGSPHETLYWRAGSQRAIRHGNWKYFIADPAMKRLYDLSEDAGKKKNFYSQRT